MAATPSVCPRCHVQVPTGVAFCPSCGARTAGPRRLLRNRSHEKLAGVCAGLADYFDIDPTLVRAIYAVATFFTGIVPGLVLYVVLMLIIPTE